VKPQHVDLRDAGSREEVAGRVVRTRWREARELSGRLETRDSIGLHQLRIAVKRLRYALERFEDDDPTLHDGVELLATLQDALGEAHDRDVLLAILPLSMPQTQCRLRDQRERYVDAAVVIWARAEHWMRSCALIVFE
jgi:CHAD domain-containing protein